MKSMFKRLPATLVVVLALGAIASASASAHQWKVNGVEASGQEVTISGGSATMSAGTKVISCTHISGKGTVKAAGLGEAAELKWTGCTTSEAGCKPYTAGQPVGTILAASVPTKLVERESTNQEKVLAEEFKGSHNGNELLLLKFEGTCTAFPEGKVSGEIAGGVTNLASGNVKAAFANELKGNTLTYFGLALTWALSFEQHLAAGGTLTAS